MPGTLGELFTYAGTNDPASLLFYQQISNNTDSIQCHTTLLSLLMNALKLSSIRYRTGTFKADPSIPAIANESILNLILMYSPQDLLDPMEQVMFELWNTRADSSIGNNAWFMETYVNSTNGAAVPQTLQDAVDWVRAAYYTQLYNDLQKEYSGMGWKVSQIPGAMPNSSTQTPPTKADVITGMQALKLWINTNDPNIIPLTSLRAQTNVAAMLNILFGAIAPTNVNLINFVSLIIELILSNNLPIGDNGKTAGKILLEAVYAKVNNTSSVWFTNTTLLPFTQYFTNKKVDQWRRQIDYTLQLISQLFQVGLNLSDTTALNAAKTDILDIFTTFNTQTTSKPTYLYSIIQAVCDNVAKKVNYDPSALDGWVSGLNEAPPKTIYYNYCSSLMDEVCNMLRSIPLQYNGTNVELFPFSSYSDLNAKPKASTFYSGLSDYDSDFYNIYPDPNEYLKNPNPVAVTTPFRPVYGNFTFKSTSSFLKFFNVGGKNGLVAGSFYFTNTQSPSIVCTVNFSDSVTPVTFDLAALTVNGLSQVPAAGISGVMADGFLYTMPGGTPYKIQNGRSISRANFLYAVKLLTKWKDIDGQRQYEVVYTTRAGSPVLFDAHLFWYVAPGNLDRTDKIDDSLYVWQWQAPADVQKLFPALPALLGLSSGRRLDGGTVKLAGTIVDKPTKDFGWYLEKIITAENGKSYNYVPVSLPQPNLPSEIDKYLNRQDGTSKSIQKDSLDILSLFDFKYYRKVDLTTGIKVIKWLPANQRPNSTGDGIDLGDVGQPQVQTAIGINIPIAINKGHNTLFFKTYTGATGPANTSLKNKGNALYKTKGKRLQAGSVMNAISGSLASTSSQPAFPGNGSSLPATDFANWVLAQSTQFVLAEWQQLKMSGAGALPTDQEWCHLLGHGDGGDERLGNFVSGSFHCNTEQLAMESKERRGITQAAPKGTYELRATAYLFNDNMALLGNNYLTSDMAYKKMTSVYNANRQSAGKTVKPSGAGQVMPLAAFIRYKMYGYAPDSGSTNGKAEYKLFDHVFEGQSEFIDEHQFTILKYASYFAVAGSDRFKEWYNAQPNPMEM